MGLKVKCVCIIIKKVSLQFLSNLTSANYQMIAGKTLPSQTFPDGDLGLAVARSHLQPSTILSEITF